MQATRDAVRPLWRRQRHDLGRPSQPHAHPRRTGLSSGPLRRGHCPHGRAAAAKELRATAASIASTIASSAATDIATGARHGKSGVRLTRSRHRRWRQRRACLLVVMRLAADATPQLIIAHEMTPTQPLSHSSLALALIFIAELPTSARGQSATELSERCAELVEYYDRYGASRSHNSDGLRNHTRLGAEVDCDRGRYAEGITAMEGLLRRKRFTVPPAPARYSAQ
jgi:hypothetical protein